MLKVNPKYLIGGLAAVSLPAFIIFLIGNSLSRGWLGISGGGTIRDQMNQYGLTSLNYDSSYAGEDSDPDWTKIARRYIRNVTDNYLIWRRSDFFTEELSKEFCRNSSSEPKHASTYLSNTSQEGALKNGLCWQEPGYVSKETGDIDLDNENIRKVVHALKAACKKVMDLNVSFIYNETSSNDSGFSNWNKKVRKHDAISYCTKPKRIHSILENFGYEPLDFDKHDGYWKENLKKFNESNESEHFITTRLSKASAGSTGDSSDSENSQLNIFKVDCLIATSALTIDSNFINYLDAAKKYCSIRKSWWKIF